MFKCNRCLWLLFACITAVVLWSPPWSVLAADPVPTPLSVPYVGPNFRITGTGCNGSFTDAEVDEFVLHWGMINGHADAPSANYWADDACGTDGSGKSIGQRIHDRAPGFLLSNYRNGSYTNQGNLNEASESEQNFPMGIAVL